MVLDAFLPGDDKSNIAKASLIYITKKTVRFGDDVSQFRNVTGFGMGQVVRNKIPWMTILLLFGIGLLPFLFYIPILLAILAIIYNLSLRELFGLKLYVNSGDAQIFITSNTDWLKRAIGTLYDFMENAEEGSTMTIQVGGNIDGNIIQGGKVRDVSSNISKVLEKN